MMRSRQTKTGSWIGSRLKKMTGIALSLFGAWGGGGKLISLRADLHVTLQPFALMAHSLAEGVTSVAPPLIRADDAHHHIDLTTRQVSELLKSDLLCLMGSKMEGDLSTWLNSLGEARMLAFEEIPVIANWILQKEKRALEEGRDFDPHIWLSPHVSRWMAEAMAEKLCHCFPDHQPRIKKNLQAFLEALSQFELHWHHRFLGRPQKTYGITHGGITYLVETLGLQPNIEMPALHHHDPSGLRLKDVAGKIEQRKIRVIFFEEGALPAWERLFKRLDVTCVYLDVAGSKQFLELDLLKAQGKVPYVAWLETLAQAISDPVMIQTTDPASSQIKSA